MPMEFSPTSLRPSRWRIVLRRLGWPSHVRPARHPLAMGCTAIASVLVLGACTHIGAAPAADRASQTLAQADTGDVPVAASGKATEGFAPDVLYKLLVAEFAAQRNDWPLAVRDYLEAARETKDPEIAERAVRMAVYARDQKHGLEAARLWTRLAPDSADAKEVYAALLIRAGRVDDAVHELRQLLARKGTHPGQVFGLVSDMLGHEHDKKAAMEVMERLVKGYQNDPDALLAFAQLAARVGDVDRAAELLAKVLELDPTNANAAIFYAQAMQRQGHTAEALKTLARIVEAHPKQTSLRMTYARLLVDAKRYEDARAQFEKLAADEPKNADVHFALGLLLLQTNHPEKAKAQFEHLLQLGQRKRTANFYLGQIAESMKDDKAAIAYYRKVDSGEHYLSAQIRVAVLLADEKGVAAARAHLEQLPKRNAADAVRIYRAEAELLAQHDDYHQALDVYNKALDAFPKDTDLLYGRAMLAEKMNNLQMLESDLRTILKEDPNNADALNALGYTLADRTDRYQEAYKLIQKALALKPNDYYILDSMGWVLYRMGRNQEALKYLREALDKNYDPEIAAHLGEVLWVSGEKKKAREVWDSALKNTPDDKHLQEVIKRFSE